MITALNQSQAKIDIVESDPQVHLIEATELLEDSLPHHQAGAGYRGNMLLKHRPIEVAGMSSRDIRKRMASNAAETEHDSAVLQCSIRKPQTRPDRADLWLRGLAHHFRQPGRIVGFGVVV